MEDLKEIYRKVKNIILSYDDRFSDDFIIFRENWEIKIKYNTISWVLNTEWKMMCWKVKILKLSKLI